MWLLELKVTQNLSFYWQMPVRNSAFHEAACCGTFTTDGLSCPKLFGARNQRPKNDNETRGIEWTSILLPATHGRILSRTIGIKGGSMHKTPERLTIAEKLSAGGLLDFRREFCPWIGVSPVTAYKEVKAGRVTITKIGRKSMVAAEDAIAYRELLRRTVRVAAA
jgi:hypothetical protein